MEQSRTEMEVFDVRFSLISCTSPMHLPCAKERHVTTRDLFPLPFPVLRAASRAELIKPDIPLIPCLHAAPPSTRHIFPLLFPFPVHIPRNADDVVLHAYLPTYHPDERILQPSSGYTKVGPISPEAPGTTRILLLRYLPWFGVDGVQPRDL